jgi:hypothetical protein
VGAQLYVTTVASATIYKLVGIKWLDDLAGTEDPDIFLTYFTGWFKYATLAALNVYLKDNERFPVDEKVLTREWGIVTSMDGSISQMGESADLD